jgi:acetyltransferase-like isoleucine patch superfamily enzyme
VRRAGIGRLARRAYRHIVSDTPWRLLVVNALLRRLPVHVAGRWRARLYRLAGFTGIHPSVHIQDVLDILYPEPRLYEHVRIGPGTVIVGPCTLNPAAPIVIGAGVGICRGVAVMAVTHAIGPPERRMGQVLRRGVRIEDGVWLGAYSIIGAGVTVGRGSVVLPGSVVLRDVPPNAKVQGSPARIVGWLDGRAPSGPTAPAERQRHAPADGALTPARAATRPATMTGGNG